MKVKELIEELLLVDPELPVEIRLFYGYGLESEDSRQETTLKLDAVGIPYPPSKSSTVFLEASIGIVQGNA